MSIGTTSRPLHYNHCKDLAKERTSGHVDTKVDETALISNRERDGDKQINFL